MKTLCIFALSFLISSSIAMAGAVSSGGVNRVVELCQNEAKDVTLTVEVVNNDHLEGSLLDAQGLKGIRHTVEAVAAERFGYKGETVTVNMRYADGVQYADVMISAKDGREVSVYPNLVCKPNFR